MAVFAIKNRNLFLNSENYQNLLGNNSGLGYNTAEIGELVSRDLDADGVLDWEEVLWGTDPTKRDTDGDGEMDDVAIEKLSAQGGPAPGGKEGEQSDANAEDPENLTQTEQFSRELFATVASLGTSGSLDDATIEKIGDGLAGQIQNPAQRKVFNLSDLKISSDESTAALRTYDGIIGRQLYDIYPIDPKVITILKDSMVGEDSLDSNTLAKLDPIRKQLDEFIKVMATTSVPAKMAHAHLALLNALERISENLSDMKNIDGDPLVAMGAISQYYTNSNEADTAIRELAELIQS